MNQSITGYHKDAEDHWVAELECGHAQHVRHDPPWTERVWVTTLEGRNSHLGKKLNCIRCDEMGNKIAKAIIAECHKKLIESYEEAGISGLCHEGQWELALSHLSLIDLKNVVENSLTESDTENGGK